MRRVLRILLVFVFIIFGLFLLFLVYSGIKEFKPVMLVELHNDTASADQLNDTIFSALIWNIGYAGLGKEMDFFYDGGQKVRDSRSAVIENMQAIENFLQSVPKADFYLMQEVDLNSKRSYSLNQFDSIKKMLPDYSGYIGINYQVGFVPVPPKSPMGRVNSGIAIFSDKLPLNVTRQGFEANYRWPTSLFMLKRCFLVNRYTLKNGNELVVVNIHNSAYDDGSLRKAQLRGLEQFAQNEYQEGNYVLMAGDWNQLPKDFDPAFDEPFDTLNLSFIDQDFLAGWTSVFPDSVPTNRRVTTPYRKGETPVTVIDFFYLSPNIRPLSLETYDLSFANSDHNPVRLTFSLISFDRESALLEITN